MIIWDALIHVTYTIGFNWLCTEGQNVTRTLRVLLTFLPHLRPSVHNQIFTSTNDFVNRLLENVKAHYHCMMSSGDVSVLSFSSRTNALSRTTFHTM